MKKKSTRTAKVKKKKSKHVGFSVKLTAKSLKPITGEIVDREFTTDKDTGIDVMVTHLKMPDGTTYKQIEVLPPVMKTTKAIKRLLN